MSYKLKLTKKEEIARDTLMVRFEKPEGFAFVPGQTMQLSFPEIDEKRAFSIASAPHEDELVFAMRLTGSKFKEILKDLPLGSTVEAEGPFGSRFVLPEETNRPVIFIAGGIGITPLLSMLSHIVEENLNHNVTLFYSNRKKEDTSFLDDLHGFSEKQSSFTFVPTLTKEKISESWSGEIGYVTPEMIKKHTEHSVPPIFYVAGPPDMVISIGRALEDSGVYKDSIITKKFTGYVRGGAHL